MEPNIATAGTMPASIPAAIQAAGGKEYTDEEVRRLVAALEEPFDPQEIKWRVTNTTKDRRRGQVVAYTDQSAYTDRLNAIFTVRGWTRKYAVETINNVERKTSHESESQMVGKLVVTCEVSIYGLGTHFGIGEEWADNENAGTAAEAQAFKRACACFGLGRYLYDLEGGWVELDNRKQPKSTPKLPDWALPKRRATNGAVQKSANPNGHAPQNRAAAQNGGALGARVQSLSEQVVMVACDFFVVITTAFRTLYVFVVMEIESRRILHTNATAQPTAEWTLRQFGKRCRATTPTPHALFRTLRTVAAVAYGRRVQPVQQSKPHRLQR